MPSDFDSELDQSAAPEPAPEGEENAPADSENKWVNENSVQDIEKCQYLWLDVQRTCRFIVASV